MGPGCSTVFRVLSLGLPALAAIGLAQTPAAPPATPVLKANSQTVLLDVVVQDHHGQALQGLKKDILPENPDRLDRIALASGFPDGNAFLARHEEVVVLNRERPVYVLVNPEDHARASGPARRGRPLREALVILAGAPLPDPDFGGDMRVVLDAIGPMPEDPWAPS